MLMLAGLMAALMASAFTGTGQPGQDDEMMPDEDGETPDEPKQMDMLGLTLQPLTPEIRQQLGLQPGDDGLLVSNVDPSSEAYVKGLREGDLITEAGQQRVVRLQDLEDRIQEARDGGRKSILLLIRRGGDPRFVALSID